MRGAGAIYSTAPIVIPVLFIVLAFERRFFAATRYHSKIAPTHVGSALGGVRVRGSFSLCFIGLVTLFEFVLAPALGSP